MSTISSFDNDGNGVLGEKEFRSWFSSSYNSEENALAATFRSYDRNGDKKVSGSEIRMMYEDEGPCGRIFGLDEDNLEARKAVFRLIAFDDNGDGELNEEEFGSWYNGDGFNLAWKKHLLNALDNDRSGSISREEYRAALDLWDFTAGALFSDVVGFAALMCDFPKGIYSAVLLRSDKIMLMHKLLRVQSEYSSGHAKLLTSSLS